MSQHNTSYNEIIQSAKDQAITEQQAAEKLPGYIAPGSGVKFSLYIAQYDERPLIRVSCSKCKILLFTQNPDFKWEHCGMVSKPPVEVSEQLKRMQIKKGLRRAEGLEGFVKDLLGKKPEPTPALSNF